MANIHLTNCHMTQLQFNLPYLPLPIFVHPACSWENSNNFLKDNEWHTCNAFYLFLKYKIGDFERDFEKCFYITYDML